MNYLWDTDNIFNINVLRNKYRNLEYKILIKYKNKKLYFNRQFLYLIKVVKTLKFGACICMLCMNLQYVYIRIKWLYLLLADPPRVALARDYS